MQECFYFIQNRICVISLQFHPYIYHKKIEFVILCNSKVNNTLLKYKGQYRLCVAIIEEIIINADVIVVATNVTMLSTRVIGAGVHLTAVATFHQIYSNKKTCFD